jgi:hypothetical protein
MENDKNNPQNKLQKIENEEFLPEFFYLLPDDKQSEYIEKKLQNDIDIDKLKKEKVLQSKVAEHDMAIAQDHLQSLDANRKFYTVHQKFETGSGNIEVNIRGGDTKFIVPIVATIGAIILGILFLLLV